MDLQEAYKEAYKNWSLNCKCHCTHCDFLAIVLAKKSIEDWKDENPDSCPVISKSPDLTILPGHNVRIPVRVAAADQVQIETAEMEESAECFSLGAFFEDQLRRRRDHLSWLISDEVTNSGGKIADDLIPHMEARRALDTLLNYFYHDTKAANSEGPLGPPAGIDSVTHNGEKK